VVLVLALALAYMRKGRRSSTTKTLVSVVMPPTKLNGAQQIFCASSATASFTGAGLRVPDSNDCSGSLASKAERLLVSGAALKDKPPDHVPPKRGGAARAASVADDDEAGIDVIDERGDDGERLTLKTRRGLRRDAAAQAAAHDDDDGDDGIGGGDGEWMAAPAYRGRGRGSLASTDDGDIGCIGGGDGELMAAPVHRGRGRGSQTCVDNDADMLGSIGGGDGELMAAPVHRGSGKAARAAIDADDDMPMSSSPDLSLDML